MVRSNMGATTSFYERRVWGSTEDAGARSGASSAEAREAMPPLSITRVGISTDGERRERIAALVTVAPVLLSGVSHAQRILRRVITGRLPASRRALARAQGLCATPCKKHTVGHTRASLGVALWPVRRCCAPTAKRSFDIPHPPPYWPGGGWLGPLPAALAENASQIEVTAAYPESQGGSLSGTQTRMDVLAWHRKRQLEERMRLAGPWQDQNLVFPNETGSLFNPSNLRNRSFKHIKERCGFREDLRFHDLRHTCATLLLREGVHAKVVSEMLGHASITITLNTYSHVLPDMRDSAVDAMEAALGTNL